MPPKATKSKKIPATSKKSSKKSSENRDGNKENQAQNDQHEPKYLRPVRVPVVLPAIVEKQKTVEKSAEKMPRKSNLKKRDKHPVTRSMKKVLSADEDKKKARITFHRELFSVKPPTPYNGPRRSIRLLAPVWKRAYFGV